MDLSLSYEQRLRELDLISLEKSRPREISLLTNTWREGACRSEMSSFQGCPLPGPEAVDANWSTRGFLWTLESISVLWSLLLGDLSKSSAHECEGPPLGSSAWAEVGSGGPRDPFNLSHAVILWTSYAILSLLDLTTIKWNFKTFNRYTSV